MKSKFKMAVLAISLGFGFNASALAGFGDSDACETAGYQCIQQGNQTACAYLYRYCLD